MNQSLHIDMTKNHANLHGSQSTLQVLVTKYKARKEAKRIVKSLCEVKDFESGKKQPKSFDEFLSEL